SQSPNTRWRKSRMVGYHGLSLRFRSQRQSAEKQSGTQTATPSAPARCAAVSELMTRSTFSRTAAVSMNPPTVRFARAGYVADKEGATVATLVILSAPSGRVVTVDYATGPNRRRTESRSSAQADALANPPDQQE